MFYDVLELLVNYMQFLYLTITIAPSVFPALYTSPFRIIDTIMQAITYNSRSNEHGEAPGTIEDMHTGAFFDVLRIFALTNILAPLALVLLSTLMFGPPLFIAFVYLLCTAVFVMVVGVMLLLLLQPHASLHPWPGIRLLTDALHAISRPTAVIMTIVGSIGVVLLLTLGVVLRLRWGRREREEVMEQLRHFENAPRSVEERVAEQLLRRANATTTTTTTTAAANANANASTPNIYTTEMRFHPGKEYDMEESSARAELAYRRMLWSRQKEMGSFSVVWTIVKAIAALVCCAAALLFSYVMKSEALPPLQSSPLVSSIAAVLFLFVILFTVSFILGFTRNGRQRLFAIKLWLRHLFLSVILLGVSFLYAPILRNAIGIFLCRSTTNARDMSSDHNDTNSHMGDKSEDVGSAKSVEETNRTRCNVSLNAYSSRCRVDGFISTSAVLTLVAYILFLILLYTLVTRQVLRTLKQYPLAHASSSSALLLCSSSPLTRVPLSRRGNGRGQPDGGQMYGLDNIITHSMASRNTLFTSSVIRSPIKKKRRGRYTSYYERVRLSQNEANFLYAPYTHRFRYFKLLVLAQKTAMVVFSTVMREESGLASPWTGFVSCLLLHVGFFILLIICRPYAEPLEFVVSLTLQVMLAIFAAMGLASALRTYTAAGTTIARIPDPLWSFVTSCLFIAPSLSILVGSLMTFWCCRVDSNSTAEGGQVCCFLQMCVSRVKMLLSRLKQSPCESWYEQFGRACMEKQIFIPALYFSQQGETDRQEEWERNDGNSNVNVAGTPEVIFTDSVMAPVLRAERSNLCESSARELCASHHVCCVSRAERRWALVRAAVLAGHFRHSTPHRRDVSVAISPWRATPLLLPATMSNISPMRTGIRSTTATDVAQNEVYADANDMALLLEEERAHSLAMTALLATVGNETRWGNSPSFTTPAKRNPGGGRRHAVINESSLLSVQRVLASQHVCQQEAFLERVQGFSARQRLLAVFNQHKRHITRQQRAVDCYINAQAAQTTRYLLLFLGIIASVAAALCCGGVRSMNDTVSLERPCMNKNESNNGIRNGG